LAGLARIPKGERVLSNDLAAESGLPATYLAKILVRLRKAGIVEASRGSGGGYRFRRNPDDVTLLEIVELFDGSQRESDCLLHPGHQCSNTDSCAAHLEWAEIREGYLEFLARKSVRAIASPPFQSSTNRQAKTRNSLPEEVSP